jgi:putative proteasome-type protease
MPALVFACDSRTNAGFPQISTLRKISTYEQRDHRVMVSRSPRNWSISQSVRELLQVEQLPSAGEPAISAPDAER